MRVSDKNNKQLTMSNKLYKIYLLLKVVCEQFGYNSVEIRLNASLMENKTLKSFYTFSNNFSLNVYNITIVTFFPKLTVTNSQSKDINTVIRNVFVKSIFELDDSNNAYTQELFRNIYSHAEWTSLYKHSHSNDGSKNSMLSFVKFCLGSSPITHTVNNIMKAIQDSNTTTTVSAYLLSANAFCFELKNGLEVESVEGGPYKKIANCITSLLNKGSCYNKTHLISNTYADKRVTVMTKFLDKEAVRIITSNTNLTVVDGSPRFKIDYYNIIKQLTVTTIGKQLIQQLSDNLSYFINIYDTTPTYYNRSSENITSDSTKRVNYSTGITFKGKTLKVTVVPNPEYYAIEQKNADTVQKGFIQIPAPHNAMIIINYVIQLLVISMMQQSANTTYNES